MPVAEPNARFSKRWTDSASPMSATSTRPSLRSRRPRSTGRGLKGTHCKNLFLRNYKGNRHYLVIAARHAGHRPPASQRGARRGPAELRLARAAAGAGSASSPDRSRRSA
ncbi:MAG: hypothetical protein M0C28_27290 [Candidatus Moduliflexus flocculans]|nr:hypothetical protein [Candidatus Moduliflexus flocculans]